ncbi:MAG: phosphoribosyltransferase [Rhodobacteraceae bacterium]|nr:MAG: phosphoribosyltransferase [Paracoccaceae bacterium]
MDERSAAEQRFIRPTTRSWLRLQPGFPGGRRAGPPFRYEFPVALPCGRVLALPLRALPDGSAAASLIANQASFEVNDAIAAGMAERGRDLDADLVVGLPTLGFVYAPDVARRLGHETYAPLGYSRKFWYDDALSEPVASITSPGAGKRLYVDPNLLPRLEGRRVALVDDAVSTGRTAVAALKLMARIGVEVAGVVVAMAQSTRWRAALDAQTPGIADRVRFVFGAPLFTLGPDGWTPMPGTDPCDPL